MGRETEKLTTRCVCLGVDLGAEGSGLPYQSVG